jgi:hypothetical protein
LSAVHLWLAMIHCSFGAGATTTRLR